MENTNLPQWYLIQTYSGYENSVKQSLLNKIENNPSLSELIFEIAIPTEEDIVEKNGKKKVILRKKFPAYVFLKMIYTRDVWYHITSTRGVTSFVGPLGKPTPLSDEEVKRLKLEAMDLSDINLEIGDQIRVLSGALEGFIGTVENIDVEKQKVRVLVSMFGRETPAELEFVEVEKLILD